MEDRRQSDGLEPIALNPQSVEDALAVAIAAGSITDPNLQSSRKEAQAKT